jgi:hypothetical protein
MERIIDEEKNISYKNSTGEFHRNHELPVLITLDGHDVLKSYFIFRINNKLPSWIFHDGEKRWMTRNGEIPSKIKELDHPSYIFSDGTKRWWCGRNPI